MVAVRRQISLRGELRSTGWLVPGADAEEIHNAATRTSEGGDRLLIPPNGSRYILYGVQRGEKENTCRYCIVLYYSSAFTCVVSARRPPRVQQVCATSYLPPPQLRRNSRASGSKGKGGGKKVPTRDTSFESEREKLWSTSDHLPTETRELHQSKLPLSHIYAPPVPLLLLCSPGVPVLCLTGFRPELRQE